MLYNFVPDSFHTAVTVEALRAKIDRKSAISHQHGHYDPKFQVQGVAPTNNFCTVSSANECLTTLPLTVFTQRNFVADFLQAKCIFNGNRPFCIFEAPFWDLGATYHDHLRLIGKRVVDFLLALIELFLLGVTASYERLLVENRRFRSNGGRLTQNFT